MRIWIPVGVLALSIAGSVRADIEIDYAIAGDCAMEPAGMKISGSRLRIETDGAGNRASMLFDGLEDIATYIDHAQRSWFEMEVDLDAADYMGDVAQSSVHFIDREMEKAQAQMKQACKDMKQRGMTCPQTLDPQALMAMAQGIAATSPDAAAALAGGAGGAIDENTLHQMRQQLSEGGTAFDPSALAPAVPAQTFTDSGRDENIAGAVCRWHEQHAGDVLARAQCVAAIDTLPLADRDRAGIKRAMLVLQRFGDAFQPWMQRFGVAPESTPSSRGLVLAQRCYDARGEALGSAQASLSQAALDDAVFEIPAGYRRQRMDGTQ